jgi:N6-adenosine-specific RNA methylase IME4
MKMENLNNYNSKFRVIYADPPWKFETWSEKGVEKKSAQAHYSCMNMQDIGNLPIDSISDENSILFMWATSPMIDQQIAIISDWGFKFKTIGFTWVKINKIKQTPFIGMGKYTRSNCEYCLIGIKGTPGRPKNKSISQVVMSPIREHSRKPDIIRTYIEQMYDGPRIELFAREENDGWDCFGNETKKFRSLF